MSELVCRFAPSTTGLAHPGTLLAGLLAWIDARQQGARFIVRLENLDPQRCTEAFAEEMLAALDWLGLNWDAVEYQDQQLSRYEAAMDQLAQAGRLYACSCSRSEIKKIAKPALDGGLVYPGTCRDVLLTQSDWRSCSLPIRCRLEDKQMTVIDESGHDLSQNPARDMGDPILRRRDGAFAYHLVVVVDDAAQGINRIVRGRDLASSTATQLQLQSFLGYPHPVYRHHLLLLEQQQKKLAKLHGSFHWRDLSKQMSAEACIGFLMSGLLEGGCGSMSAADCLELFSWSRFADQDRLLLWDAGQMHWGADG